MGNDFFTQKIFQLFSDFCENRLATNSKQYFQIKKNGTTGNGNKKRVIIPKKSKNTKVSFNFNPNPNTLDCSSIISDPCKAQTKHISPQHHP